MTLKQILLELKLLELYAPGEWEEYLGYFDLPESFWGYLKESSSANRPNEIRERIRKGKGAVSTFDDPQPSSKIMNARNLSKLKLRPSITLGLVSGCFDLLHINHIRGIAYARQFLQNHPGPKLGVLILQDKYIKAKKGAGRPVLNLQERMSMLCSLHGVDYVIPLEEPHCLQALALLKPNYFFKAGADREQAIVRQEIEAVERHGGCLIIYPSKKGRSTTTIIQTITSRQYGSY